MVIFIYGTGGGAKKLYENKLKKNITVKGFIDSDSNKLGKKVDFAPEHNIIGISDITPPYDLIVIASVHEEIYYSLLKNNIPEDKILMLNEHANHRIQSRNNDVRYSNIEKILKDQFLREFPLVKNLFSQGSYSSPTIDLNYVKENEETIFKDDLGEETGIELNIDTQLELLHRFSEKGNILPFLAEEQELLRFYGDNGFFGTGSAHLLSHMICNFNTKKIIEAGSGFSSASMLDLNEMILKNKLQLTFIEPNPERLHSILKTTDDIKLLQCKLQEVDLEIFRQLESGDILFIDSSHVSKIGSDVNYVMFEILPVLKSGVIIHIHDISFPFEYCREFVYEGRAWNEAYIVRAFMQYNQSFEILFWETFLYQYNKLNKIKLTENDNKQLFEGGSLYIRKK